MWPGVTGPKGGSARGDEQAGTPRRPEPVTRRRAHALAFANRRWLASSVLFLARQQGRANAEVRRCLPLFHTHANVCVASHVVTKLRCYLARSTDSSTSTHMTSSCSLMHKRIREHILSCAFRFLFSVFSCKSATILRVLRFVCRWDPAHGVLGGASRSSRPFRDILLQGVLRCCCASASNDHQDVDRPASLG